MPPNGVDVITPAIKYLKIVIPACLLQAGEGGR